MASPGCLLPPKTFNTYSVINCSVYLVRGQLTTFKGIFSIKTVVVNVAKDQYCNHFFDIIVLILSILIYQGSDLGKWPRRDIH